MSAYSSTKSSGITLSSDQRIINGIMACLDQCQVPMPIKTLATTLSMVNQFKRLDDFIPKESQENLDENQASAWGTRNCLSDSSNEQNAGQAARLRSDRFQQRNSNGKEKWTKSELQFLTTLANNVVLKHSQVSWNAVMERFQYRTMPCVQSKYNEIYWQLVEWHKRHQAPQLVRRNNPVFVDLVRNEEHDVTDNNTRYTPDGSDMVVVQDKNSDWSSDRIEIQKRSPAVYVSNPTQRAVPLKDLREAFGENNSPLPTKRQRSQTSDQLLTSQINWTDQERNVFAQLVLKVLSEKKQIIWEEVMKVFPGRSLLTVQGKYYEMQTRYLQHLKQQNAHTELASSDISVALTANPIVPPSCMRDAPRVDTNLSEAILTKPATVPSLNPPQTAVFPSNSVQSTEIPRVKMHYWSREEQDRFNTILTAHAGQKKIPWKNYESFFPHRMLQQLYSRAGIEKEKRRNSLTPRETADNPTVVNTSNTVSTTNNVLVSQPDLREDELSLLKALVTSTNGNINELDWNNCVVCFPGRSKEQLQMQFEALVKQMGYVVAAAIASVNSKDDIKDSECACEEISVGERESKDAMEAIDPTESPIAIAADSFEPAGACLQLHEENPELETQLRNESPSMVEDLVQQNIDDETPSKKPKFEEPSAASHHNSPSCKKDIVVVTLSPSHKTILKPAAHTASNVNDWTTVELETLRTILNIHGNTSVNWSSYMHLFPNRTHMEVVSMVARERSMLFGVTSNHAITTSTALTAVENIVRNKDTPKTVQYSCLPHNNNAEKIERRPVMNNIKQKTPQNTNSNNSVPKSSHVAETSLLQAASNSMEEGMEIETTAVTNPQTPYKPSSNVTTTMPLSPFTAEEKDQLKCIIDLHNSQRTTIDWYACLDMFPGKALKQLVVQCAKISREEHRGNNDDSKVIVPPLPWTREEDDLLKRLMNEYKHHGSKWSFIAEHFPRRKLRTIHSHAMTLMKRESDPSRTKERWREGEDKLLSSLIFREGMEKKGFMKDIVTHFPTRSRQAVQLRIIKLRQDKIAAGNNLISDEDGNEMVLETDDNDSMEDENHTTRRKKEIS